MLRSSLFVSENLTSQVAGLRKFQMKIIPTEKDPEFHRHSITLPSLSTGRAKLGKSSFSYANGLAYVDLRDIIRELTKDTLDDFSFTF